MRQERLPSILLIVILFAYSRGILSSRRIAQAPHFQRRSFLFQPTLPDVAIQGLMNRIHWNSRVRNEKSRQNRLSVLLQLTGIFANTVINLTENPHQLDSGGLLSFLFRISSVGPSNQTVKLRRVALTADRTFTF